MSTDLRRYETAKHGHDRMGAGAAWNRIGVVRQGIGKALMSMDTQGICAELTRTGIGTICGGKAWNGVHLRGQRCEKQGNSIVSNRAGNGSR